MSGWALLGLGLLVGVTDFLVGRYMAGLGAGGPALHADGRPLSAEAVNRVGRLVMLLSPVLFLVFAALAFGLVPIEAIEPIALGAGSGR
ncbi:MAG TPA: hypothetical protein VJS15_07230 [Allosphingosinicella sp.]|nr:hypothetical protein [Allosphingosinicella sp.]